MEQIETQASDLRFLAQAQVPLSNSPSVTYETPRLGPQQGSPGSASFGGNSAAPGDSMGASANKRKSSDDGLASAKQTRSKRNRYISIACNECKRRKIKCNGETPCKRCGNMNLVCLYTPNCCANTFKDSDEYKTVTTQLSILQDEVTALKQTLYAMQSNPAHRSGSLPSGDRPSMPPGMIAPSPAQSSLSGRQASASQVRTPGAYRGSTSSSHMIGIAQNNSGIAYPDLDGIPETQPQSTGGAMDPILGYSEDEMIRLCSVHDNEIGVMYPVLDIKKVEEHARNLTPKLDGLRQQRSTQLMNDDETLELKMIMCCALVVEDSGPSKKARELFESMEPVLNRKLLTDDAYQSILPLLCLFAGYRFLTDNEGLAWRVIGQVCRLCLELGLHRAEVLNNIPNVDERRRVVNSFWSAYVLDRRWAFNTGLPYVIQDEDVDPKLLYPTDYPYLVSMIGYSKLAAKVWSLVEQRRIAFGNNGEACVQDMDRINTEINEWYRSVPAEVQITQDWRREGPINATSSYNLQRLRVWTYLRLNQIRGWLYAPILHTTESILAAPDAAQMAVEVAQDTIEYLVHVNNSTDMVKKSQAFYSQFLVSALAIMFLASTQAPVQFSVTCRQDFYKGIALIEDLSPHSHISKRLWRIVWSLRDYLAQIYPHRSSNDTSNAALGMIGLATGRPMDEPTRDNYTVPEQGNGHRLQNQFCSMYEEMVTSDSFRGVPDPAGAQQPEQFRYTAQQTFYDHMRHMF